MVSKKQPLHLSVKRRSQSGSVILSVLAIAVMIVILILSSTNFIRSRVNQIFAATEKMANRIVLDGLLAYTVNGIKQSWCFSTNWAQDDTCSLINPRYTARMLLSDETIAYIKSSGMTLPTGELRVTEITQTVTIAGLPESHPVYNLTLPFKGAYTTIEFSIKRDDSAIATTKGREVPLRINIKVNPRPNSKYQPLEINSKVIVYPRELSYFALIVPNNLNLGSTGNTATGDVGLTNISVAANKGLRFESPVFVNGNLVLPSKNLTTAMNNVTFVDKVVIGEGMIQQDGALFIPKNPGGDDSMYNYKLPSFNGLIGGYELDVQRDRGLDYLFDILPPSGDLSNFDLCKLRLKASYDLTVTKDSQLFVKATSWAADVANVTASMGIIDNLIEQDGSSSTILTNVPGVTTAGAYDSYATGGVFRAKLVYEGLRNPSTGVRGVFTNTFILPRSGKLRVYPVGTAGSYPQVVITTSPHYVSSKAQHNQVDLKIEFLNSANLDIGSYDSNGIKMEGGVRLVLEAMDYAYLNSNNLRDGSSQNAIMGPYKTNGFSFVRSGTSYLLNADAANVWYTNPRLTVDPAYVVHSTDPVETPTAEVDFTAIDAQCFRVPEGSEAYFTSFPSADWSTSFVTQSKHAWSFTDDGPSGVFKDGYLDGPKYFNSGNAGASPVWNIQSRIKTCVIEPTATFVAGFYTCESLVIQARTTPLRIVGTFIAKSVTIDPTAYTSGIRWSTIYHPQAVYELRATHILGVEKDGTVIDCNDSNMPPLWASNLGVPSTLKHYICNPVSLRTADPFKWTTVDPDCGIADGQVAVKCKKAMTRFMIKEISRSKGL